MTPSECAAALAVRAESVCRWLLPGGRRKQAEWVAADLGGGKGESLKVRIGGEDAHRIGIWSDFATGESGGDLLDLWCATRKIGLSKAIQEASTWLGVRLDGESSRPKRSWSVPAKPSCSKLPPESPQCKWFESRHLSPATIAAYRIGLNTIGELIFPYLKPDGTFVNAKYRRLPKTFRQEAGAEPCLFGWHVVETHYPNSRWCVLVEGECLTGDAQLLTPGGWVRMEDYEGGQVAQWQDGRIEFVEPLAIIRKPFAGELIEYQSQQFYSLTTPGHKMVSLDKQGHPYFHTAEAGPRSSAHHLPRCGILDGPGIPLTHSQIALCLAVSADAAIDVRKNAYGSQPARRPARYSRYARFGFRKQRKIASLERIVRECGLEMSSNPVSNGIHSICFGLPDWVPGRLLPWEWIERATAEQREFILHELTEWDGNHVPNRTMTEYSSKLIENAEWVQALAHTTGRCSSIVDRENEFGAWFKVTILHEKHRSSWQAVREDRIPHDGLVYCVTVPSGAIMVRQQGIVSITGNCDAMSLHEVGIPALSVPMGGGKGHKQDWIESDYDLLQRFDTLYLCLDNDAAGREGTTEIVGRLGAGRCRLVDLPFKDANEALMHGWNHAAFMEALNRAKTLDPEELKSASHFMAQVLDSFTEDDPHRPPPGIATPWPSVGRNFLFRPGEVTLWGGYSGSGKSAITNHIAAYALTRHSRWCIASMEMPATQTLHRMVLQILGAAPALDPVRQCVRWLGDKLWMFDVMGTSKVERMLDVFAYAVGRYDIRNFIVDSLAKCGLAEDDWNSQKQFVEQLTDFARHHQSHVHLVAHARKGEGESCQRPTKHDIRGTSAITDMVHNVVTIWRDKDSEQNTNTNRVVLDVCKQRNHTWEHRIELLYDTSNFRYIDETGPDGEYPMPGIITEETLDKTT